MLWALRKFHKTFTVHLGAFKSAPLHTVTGQIFLESHSAGQRSALFSKTSCTVTNIPANSNTRGLSFSVRSSISHKFSVIFSYMRNTEDVCEPDICLWRIQNVYSVCGLTFIKILIILDFVFVPFDFILIYLFVPQLGYYVQIFSHVRLFLSFDGVGKGFSLSV